MGPHIGGYVNSDWLQYPGMALSLLGAFLVAGRSAQWRRAGFTVWLISNAVLFAWALSVHAWGVAVMYIAFFLTSAWGLRNNRRGSDG